MLALAMVDSQWYKDEGFWASFAPLMFDERRWAETEGVCEALGALIPPGSRVLDALCGPGRVSLELGRRAYSVLGVDLCPAYLEAARAGAEYEGLDCQFWQGDIRQFSAPGQFQAAINLYNSFGYLESPEDDGLMLERIRQSLAPGSPFAMEFQSAELVRRDFRPSESWSKGDVAITVESRLSQDGDYLSQVWRADFCGKAIEGGFRQRLYDAEGIRRLLGRLGFRELEVYGGYDWRPFDDQAACLLAIARSS